MTNHHHHHQLGTLPAVVGVEESPPTAMRLLTDALVGYEVAARAQDQANHHHHHSSPPSIELLAQLNVFREFAGYVDSHYPSDVTADPIMGEARQTIQRLCPRVNNLSVGGAATGSGGPGALDDDARNDVGLAPSLVSSPAPFDVSSPGTDAALPGPDADDHADGEGWEDDDADIEDIPSSELDLSFDGAGGDILGFGASMVEDEDARGGQPASGGGAGTRRDRVRGDAGEGTARRRSASPPRDDITSGMSVTPSLEPLPFWWLPSTTRLKKTDSGRRIYTWPDCPGCNNKVSLNWSEPSLFFCRRCWL